MADARGVVVEHAPTFHTFRHTHGSMLIADGRDIAEVSARLGHSNTTVTLSVYVHEFDKMKRSSERRDRLARLSVVTPVVAADDNEPKYSSTAPPPEAARIHAV